MEIQQNLSLDYLKNYRSSGNNFDRTIGMVQHFPPVPCYSGRQIPCIITNACFNIFLMISSQQNCWSSILCNTVKLETFICKS